MLRSTFMVKHNLNLKKFTKLLAYIKEQNSGYKPTKSSIFTREDVNRFLMEAPDEKYLMWKVSNCFNLSIT